MLVIVLILVSAVIFVVTSNAGANLALRLGLSATGGTVGEVRGSLWRGLDISELQYRSETLDVDATGVRLAVDWPALARRQLRVVEASVQSLSVDLRSATTDAPPEPDTPFTIPEWPALPGSVELRRVALGELRLTQDGEPVPVQVRDVVASFTGDTAGGLLVLESASIQAPDASADLRGTVSVAAGSPLTLDARVAGDVKQAELAAELDLSVQGTVEDLAVTLVGSGQGMSVDASARLAPLSSTLPVRALRGQVRGIDPGAWVDGLPQALLNLTVDAQLDGVLLTQEEVQAVAAADAATPAPDAAPAPAAGAADKPGAPSDPAASAAASTTAKPAPAAAPAPTDWRETIRDLRARVSLSIDEGSLWQKQPLRGKLEARLEDARLPELALDLAVATNNTVRIRGAFGGPGDEITFALAAPRPAAFWPGLEGSATLEGRLRGMLEKHELAIKGRVDHPLLAAQTRAAQGRTPPGPAVRIETVAPGQNEVVDTTDTALDLPTVFRQGALDLQLALAGGWNAGGAGELGPGRDGWRGTVGTLDVRNRQAGIVLGSPAAVSVVPGEPLLWSVGQTSIQLRLPGQRAIVIAHRASSGSGEQWRSAGGIDSLTPAWLVSQLPRVPNPLRVDLAWDLDMGRALSGTVDLTRRSGDVAIPGSPPVAIGLTEMRVRARATPTSGGASALSFDARVAGKLLGSIDASGTTAITVVDGIPMLPETEPVTVDAKLALADIAVFSSFVGDTIDIGGRLAGDVRVQRQGGVWTASGPLTASGLRVVLIDEGIRLLDGSLQARLAGNQLVVDSLRFPGVIRSAPRDSRIQNWLARNGGGAVEASGSWSLETSSGNATVNLTRFPLVQRADRFIVGSGTIDIAAGPKRLDITGKATADVGWISLEGASDVPTLASDVVIVRAGDTASERSEALPMRLNLEVDLGRQFYLRGMGLDAALEGSIRIRNTAAGLRANGVVNTRDARYSIYGQNLVVRKGVVTFQGLLDDPLLDIIAVREGVRIEAGVQVSGTARQPVISLVSYPDVPEVEKLSWLLLGRGPDASGADAGMLLAAAASLLGDEDSEPLYRQLGLDELGLRSGLNSGLGGLLPERTVVGSITSSTDNQADAQFLVIGKKLSDGIYLTFEQALSGSETVVRASYQISERLTAAVQGGTINGLRLVWSLVFDD